MKKRQWLLTVIFLAACSAASAEIKEYTLTIERSQITINNKASNNAMSVNGSIPGPTLFFTEGDTAKIHVKNDMNVESSIHWHRILLPPGMDGVPYLTYPPIKPGTTFTYEFPIRQSGTYWYHSHSHFQEQRGVYGSIVINSKNEKRKYDKDYVILLSDWTNEDPHAVMQTLKRGSEWYAVRKGNAQSVWQAFRLGMLKDFFARELQRMPPMDISDVAYDAFLANGKQESFLDAKPGDTIRLRIIDGSATTFFHFEFAGGPMMFIAADGIDVQTFEEDRVLIGVAETYDVLVTIPDEGMYEFRATAQDGSGKASVWIGSGKKVAAKNVPNANLYHAMGSINLKQLFALTPAGAMGMSDRDVDRGKFDRPGMMNMGGMDHSMRQTESAGHSMHQMRNMDSMDHSMHEMDHSMHHMNHEMPDAEMSRKSMVESKLVMDGMTERPWPPYDKLRALHPTHFSDDKPVREYRFTLDEDMERYVWFLNNRPLEESDYVHVKEGEVVRFIMINRTMMHHPMHLHGHFFRVLNEQGDYSPLKHTVDVEPMSTTVIEFDANEFGDWFFHCHLLYHMMSGMARVIHYEGYEPSDEVKAIRPDLNHNPWYYFADGDFLSHMTQGNLTMSNQRNIVNLEWEYGWQDVDEDEWEGIATWDYYFNRFFRVFAGVDVLGESDEEKDTRGIAGIRYVLPLNIETSVWADTEGGARFTLDKHLPLTSWLSLVGDIEYDTHDKWEQQAGLEYLLNKDSSIKATWHSDFGVGGGINIRF